MAYGENADCPDSSQETLVLPEDVVPFADREMHLPALPRLCIHMPFETAMPLSHLVPEPVEAGQTLGSFAA
jgi:hypothetical protein